MEAKKRRKSMAKRAEDEIRFRCTKQQRWTLEKAAESEGLSLSAYVRQAALSRVRHASAQEAAPEMLALFKQAIKDN